MLGARGLVIYSRVSTYLSHVNDLNELRRSNCGSQAHRTLSGMNVRAGLREVPGVGDDVTRRFRFIEVTKPRNPEGSCTFEGSPAISAQLVVPG